MHLHVHQDDRPDEPHRGHNFPYYFWGVPDPDHVWSPLVFWSIKFCLRHTLPFVRRTVSKQNRLYFRVDPIVYFYFMLRNTLFMIRRKSPYVHSL